MKMGDKIKVTNDGPEYRATYIGQLRTGRIIVQKPSSGAGVEYLPAGATVSAVQ